MAFNRYLPGAMTTLNTGLVSMETAARVIADAVPRGLTAYRTGGGGFAACFCAQFVLNRSGRGCSPEESEHPFRSLHRGTRQPRKVERLFMQSSFRSIQPGIRVLAAAVILAMVFFPGAARAITVTGTTSDNGYPAHLVQWTDAAGNPRSAMMVDQNSVSPGPYTGYLRQYTYSYVSGTAPGSPLKVRVCTGSQNYATGGNLEFSGDGFIQNHGVNGDDSSTGNIAGFPGTTTISGSGTHVVTVTYSIPDYTVQDLNGDNQTVPSTVQWFFADGRNDPIFAVTQDSTATPGSLGLDSRSPYGDMAYDGVLATSNPPETIIGTVVGGYSYGDQYKFVTLAANPEQVTPASPWKATQANTIPYAMQWAQTSATNAEMGHVATVPITVSDAGSDSQTSPYYDDGNDYSAALYFDPRTQSYPSGPLPPWNTQAFQIINEPGGLNTDVGLATPLAAEWEPNDGSPNPPTDPKPTTTKRLAWQTNFGRVGGWNVYDEYSDSVFNYSTHVSDTAPASESYQGTPRVSGALMSYSTYVVFGPHITGTNVNVIGSSYQTGAVGSVVTQMQNVTKAVLSGSLGTVTTVGPAGIPTSGSATAANTNKTVTYSPKGYDPIYGTWDLSGSNNEVNATLAPAANMPLVNPVFVLNGYTSTQLPAAMSTGTSASSPSYYATVDAAHQRLWVTVNKTITSPVNWVAKIKADFAGNGSPDLLFQNSSTGQAMLWLMNGTTFLSSKIIGNEPPPWTVVGTGDFYGNGNIDVVLQNYSTGEIMVWSMNGTSFGSLQYIGTESNTNWKIAATGDFNGDGKPDLLWQNTSNGGVVIWQMNGTSLVSTTNVGVESNTNWAIVGTGDFNGDGNTDIVWQNNSTGQVMIWFMKGTTFVSSEIIATVSNTAWKIVGTGDFNGDGKPDLIWQNTSNGGIETWLMNGTSLISVNSIGVESNTDWQIKNK
jgi:hypothetical protein